MAQVNNDPTINLSPNLCDYCHKRPKFLPYNYCGRTCGARATAVGNQVPAPIVMCKQCDQRPVYQNHQFCGRNCANAWTAVHGQINTGSLGALWPPSWNVNQQTMQGGSQPGQRQGQGGSGVRGFVQGFRSLISPTNQTQQQQQTVANPAQTQRPPNNTTNPSSILTTTLPTAVLPSATSNQLSPGSSQHPFNPPPPTIGGTSDQNNNKHLDPPNEVYPISPPPSYSATSGSSVPQIANNTDPGPSQTTSSPVWNGTSLPSYSASSLDYMSEPDDPDADALPGSYPNRESSENGDEGGGGDEMLVEDMDAQSFISFDHPPPVSTSEAIGTCRLEGCSNPTFVDSITDLESEYCSRKHREEAMVPKQETLCILCRKIPRGPNDHFCSVGCRARALFP